MTDVSTHCTFPRCHWHWQGTEAEGEAEFSTHRRIAHLLAGQYAYSTVTSTPRPEQAYAPRARPRLFTDEQILAALRTEAKGSRTLSIQVWQHSRRKPSSTTIIKHFGSWNGALRAAGLGTRSVGRPTVRRRA